MADTFVVGRGVPIGNSVRPTSFIIKEKRRLLNLRLYITNLEFVEMKSLTIPAAIQDFDYVVITGSIVYNAGIDPSTALATEDILDHLVLQVVVKEANKDTDWAQAIVDAYHSDEFKAYLKENNDGLWWVPEELQ